MWLTSGSRAGGGAMATVAATAAIMRRSIVVAVGEECKETLARLFLKHRLVGWRDMRHETADRASSSAETSAVTPRSQSWSTTRGTQLLGAPQHPSSAASRRRHFSRSETLE